jgi:endonuclease-3
MSRRPSPARKPAASAATTAPAARTKLPAAAAKARPVPPAAAAKARPAVPAALPARVREALFARLAAANPEPRSELEWATPFELLVAVVLSAQATDKGVNKATAKLFPVANTPAAIVALGVDRLIPYVQTIGLFRNKAKNIVGLARQLIERHGGEVPRDAAALEALPGVGRKTANVVRNVAFGEPTIAVDTHVFRVANRTGLASGRTPDAVEAQLLRAVPAAYLPHAHHWLILHGRYVCVARNPKCGECPVADLCRWPEKSAPAAVKASTGAKAARATPQRKPAAPDAGQAASKPRGRRRTTTRDR